MTSATELQEGLKRRLVRVAIGGSTMRGRGNGGAVDATRRYLQDLKLQRFAVTTENRFLQALNEATEGLLERLPSGARHWGLARKALNIYLRDCLYSRHMCERFRFRAAEAFFEIPLDGIVGRRLHSLDRSLPRWETIKGLTPQRSDLYQESARRVADRMGLARVDLDAIWWSEDNGPRL